MRVLLPLLIACLLLGPQLGCKSDSPPPDTGGGGTGGNNHPPLQEEPSDGGSSGDSGCVDGTTANCTGGNTTTATAANQTGGWVSSDHRSAQAISADANGNVTFPCNGMWCPTVCNNDTMTVQVDPNQTGIWQDAQGNQRQFTADANGMLVIPCSGQWNAV
jgi:hypothetical protein